MDSSDAAKLQIEAWKKTIDVQQHFNDIAMKIRALAITVLTAVLGAAALAVRDGTTVHVCGVGVSLAGAIVLIGLVAWVLFYFVDELWYHRLLLGAVAHGRALETMLTAGGVPGFELTKAIGDASPFTVNFGRGRKSVHSTTKIRVYYFTIAALLLITAISLLASTVSPVKERGPSPNFVRESLHR